MEPTSAATSWRLLATLVAVTIVGWLAYRLDSTRVARRWSVLAFGTFVLLAWYGAEAKGERRHMQFYFSNLYVSSFYASWGETLEAIWRGALLEAAPRRGGGAFHYPLAL